jgi:hypothetical protein
VPPFRFCPDVPTAISLAKAAGDGTVGVSGPSIAQQCLKLGLLDEVRNLSAREGVTHPRYRVRPSFVE